MPIFGYTQYSNAVGGPTEVELHRVKTGRETSGRFDYGRARNWDLIFGRDRYISASES